MRWFGAIRKSERGDMDIGLIVALGVITIGSTVFFWVKDWIKDTKDQRNHLGAYASKDDQDERAPLDKNRGPRGYVVTFHP